MAREVPLLMPKLSMTMETGEVLSWLKGEGDTVTAGDPIAEVQTDKVDMEVEAPVTGTLARIIAGPGVVLDVGAPMGFITSDAEDLMAGLFDPPPDPAAATAAPEPDAGPSGAIPGVGAAASNGVAAATPVSRRGPLPAVPLARRRAAQLRVSLTDVTGTGPAGVITVADVEKAAAAAAPLDPTPAAPAPAAPASAAPASSSDRPAVAAASPPAVRPVAPQREPASKGALPTSDPGFADALAPRRRAVRAAVARTMTASAAIPQFTVFAELDLESMDQARSRIGWTTLLIRGLAKVLRNYPAVNAGWDETAGGPAAARDDIGVALAIDSAIGLLAPVVRDPDLLPVQDLDALVRATVDRTRAGKLTGGDLQGATTTLSNLGGFGVPSFTSLLTPPQATALSVGAITPRPIMVGRAIAIRLGTTVGLTVDHRPVDGADGARLLADLRVLFGRPDELLA